MSESQQWQARYSFVFPGQGSQSVGMGEELYWHSKAARGVFEEADEVLGFSLSKLIFRGPEEELRDTINSQPAIMTVSIACWKAWQEMAGSQHSVAPLVVAGHSLGQYTSMVAARVIDLGAALRLVRERGRLMQEAAIECPGSMAAIIGLDEAALEHICHETGVELANINGNDQIVVSGEKEAVALAMDLASVRGAKKTLSLQVSGAFHSSLMKGAQQGLARAVSSLKFQDPKVPIIANSTGMPLTTGAAVKKELVQGLCQCVRWEDSVHSMVDLGVSEFVEFGPSVLSGLIKRIDRNVQAVALSNLSSIRSFIQEHKKAIVIGSVAVAAGTIAGIRMSRGLRNRRKKGRES